jgi:DUF1680 family protein
MKKEMTRREALRLGALTAVVPSTLFPSTAAAKPARTAARASSASAAAAASELPVPASWVVRPFALDEVTLGPSLFTENRDRILNFASNYPVDNMLYTFRANAGLPTPGSAVGGWDTTTGNLRGHSCGHHMTLLAQAYLGTGDASYKDKLDYMVTALGQCQDAITRSAGKFNNCADTLSKYVSVPAGIVNGLTDFTIACWVNPPSKGSSPPPYSYIGARIFDFGTGPNSYMYLTPSAGSAPRFGITTGGSANEQRLDGITAVALNAWTHIAVTLSGTTATLYVNGAPVATKTNMTLNPSSLGTTTNNWIGRSQLGPDSRPYLSARVDEFQIYNRALSPTEVQLLQVQPSLGGVLGAGPVVWYKFDETSGATAVDSSGNGRDATIQTSGYLAAYPEDQFVKLEAYETYSNIWAPWYTNHMTMRGLLDAYLVGGNHQALEIDLKMAGWAAGRLAQLPRDQLDRMWQIYIAGEYNASPVPFADLHALTGDEKYLATAKAFKNTYLYDAAVQNQDTINGKHANQHIPQYRGYLEIFEQTNEPDWYTAAKNFWDMVVPHRIYSDGGMAGSGEFFGARDVIASTIQAANAEGCPEYNMLMLTRQLFFHDPDPKYMQYYERALCGQTLAIRQNTSSNTNPLVTYFLPVNPGARRGYGNIGDCDGGTGPEQLTKLQESIYFRSVDDSTLYVNLYMASVLNWPEKGFTIEQSTNYPRDPAGQVTITVTGNGRLDIKLRVPYWVENGFIVRINGVEQDINAVAGTYVTLSRVWASGDTIDVSMPFSLRVEKTLDQPRVTQCIAYGPIPLVALSTSTSYLNFTLDGDLSQSITPTADPMTFTTNGVTVRPLYIDDTTNYHAYFHRVNRAPVFTPTGNQSVNSSETLTFTVEAKDPDGDPVTYTATGLPQGASFDQATGRFTWAPTAAQKGTYTVHFEASDGLLTTGGGEDVTITVDGGPTAVQVREFAARWAKGGVRLSWRTGSEADLLGFNVWRSNGRGWRQVNLGLVRAKGSGGTTGATYRFLDRKAKAGQASKYRLQIVSLKGKSRWHGPGIDPTR